MNHLYFLNINRITVEQYVSLVAIVTKYAWVEYSD